MTTHRDSILGANLLPDTSGNVFWEPYDIKATNDRWKHGNWIFNDTSTDLVLSGTYELSMTYVGTSKIYFVWTSTATSGNVKWGFKYRAITGDNAESLDQTGEQEAVTVVDAAPGAANRRMEVSIALTAGNFAAGDTVEFELIRHGSDTGNDTMAAAAILKDALFEYADA